MVVPDTTTNNVEYNALKAVIIAHWPVLVWRSRKLWHDLFCQHHILRYQIGGSRLCWYHMWSYFCSQMASANPKGATPFFLLNNYDFASWHEWIYLGYFSFVYSPVLQQKLRAYRLIMIEFWRCRASRPYGIFLIQYRRFHAQIHLILLQLLDYLH